MNHVLKLLALSLAFWGVNATASEDSDYIWRDVSGTGVHYFSTAVIHSQKPTKNGLVQRSTETIELSGDLIGRVLYQPVTRINNTTATLVNRGHQAFSGTILGAGPVMLFDDSFRFEVNLATGETIGRILLVSRLAGPIVRCELTVNGFAETTAAGDSIISYSGRCRMPR